MVHRLVVAAVSAVLFVLLAGLSVLTADLDDYSFPVALGTHAVVDLDLERSGLSEEAAFAALAARDEQWDLGLFKVAPDLGGDQSGEVFVALVDRPGLPETIDRFGERPDAGIADFSALVNSYAGGPYLVTGDGADIAQFRQWLRESSITATWTSAGSPRDLLGYVTSQASFLSSLVAAVALVVALALYWLSVKAKGRALRVIGGAPMWRVQVEDLAGLLAPVAATAALIGVAACCVVGVTQGWVFVPRFGLAFLGFGGVALAVGIAFAGVMSFVARPRAAMIARREPAVSSLQGVSVALKVVTFPLVLLFVAAGATAVGQARDLAADQAAWRSLADQVSLKFSFATSASDGGDAEFQAMMPQVGQIVRDAQEQDAVALSYAFQPSSFLDEEVAGYQQVALVDWNWIDLVTRDDPARDTRWERGATPVPVSDLPPRQREAIAEQIGILRRTPATDPLSGFQLYEYSSDVPFPVLSGGGGDDLEPMRRGLVLVAPDLYQTFNDDFLISAASTSNVSFTGVGSTESLVARYGLERQTTVRYTAEAGILVAQYTAYFARLQALSLAALLTVLMIAIGVGATIAAMIHARRDFALRVNGWSWWRIVSGRSATELLVGSALASVVIVTRPSWQELVAVTAVAVLGLLVSPVAHIVATRWGFAAVRDRRL